MKNWVRPMAVEENFMANTSVSACYSLTCTLPGNNPYTEDGDNYKVINESDVGDRGSIYSIWGEQHFRGYEGHNSNCAKPARWNDQTGVFIESGSHKAIVKDAKVDLNVSAGAGKHPAIWTSTFTAVGGLIKSEYHHIGFAVDESAAHPNRS